MSAGAKIYTLSNTHMVDPAHPENIISIMPYDQAPFLLSPVVLHSNVWLGINVIVMPSVVIGKNSFCVSNSLLMKNFGENSYIAGQPASLIRNRFLTF
jgi:acetyltransferase-like isoleucine patch superfamily enzyme